MFRGAKALPSRLHKACFATEMGAVGRRSNARGRQLSDYEPIAKTRENGVFGDQWEVEQKNSLDCCVVCKDITSRWSVGLRRVS